MIGLPTGITCGMISHGRGRSGANGTRCGSGFASEPASFTCAPWPVWLSGISARTIATDLDTGNRGKAGSSAVSLPVSIGTIEGGLDGLELDTSGRSVSGPGVVELSGRDIIGVEGDESSFATTAKTGIGGAGASKTGASASSLSGKATSARAGIATAVSVMAGPPSDRLSTNSTVSGGETTDFFALISALAVCCCVGAIAVAKCDAAKSPVRKAKLIGMLRLRRSATGSFQIHELQLLYHHSEAVGPLTG